MTRAPTMGVCVALAIGLGIANAQTLEPPRDPAAAALLAVEEAELRERMVTGLAIAEGLRLRGRTILVAITEIRRVRESAAAMHQQSDERRRLMERLDTLERRRAAVENAVDVEFDAYVEIVGELAGDLWPRLRRVRANLESDLASRGLMRLAHLLPLMTEHVTALHERGALDPALRDGWRRQIDDSFTLRRQRSAERAEPGRSAPPSTRGGDDI